MIRARVRDDLERVRDLPFYPVFPLVPIALIVTNLALMGFLYWKVSKIENAVSV